VSIPQASLGRLMSVGEMTVLACRQHVFVSDGFRQERCIHCGMVVRLRWWSFWDDEVVAIYVGRERLWPTINKLT
jgi:hypothetical protein